MKATIVLESHEKEALKKICDTDPCEKINCGIIECEDCPLHAAAVAFNEARHSLRAVVAIMETVESEGK